MVILSAVTPLVLLPPTTIVSSLPESSEVTNQSSMTMLPDPLLLRLLPSLSLLIVPWLFTKIVPLPLLVTPLVIVALESFFKLRLLFDLFTYITINDTIVCI